MSDPASVKTLGEALPPGSGVCVINLDQRRDRWSGFERSMMPHLAPLPVRRIPAVEGVRLPGYGEPPLFRGRKRDRTWGARAGCTLSHRAALMHAYEAGWSHALVLEDDVHVPEPPDGPLLESLRRALQGAVEYDVCYLGYTDPVPPFRELARLGDSHGLHQVFGCNTAHAYLVSRRAMSWLLEHLPRPPDIWHWLSRHRAVDRFYYRNLSPALAVTAVSPTIIHQEAGFSDIIGRDVAAYSELHRTAIEAAHPAPEDFQAGLDARAAAFARAGTIDRLRGAWKRLRGF